MQSLNKEVTYQKHMKTDHVGLVIYVGAITDSIEKNSSNSNNSNSKETTLLTLPYHLRKPREQQKQKQQSKPPSV